MSRADEERPLPPSPPPPLAVVSNDDDNDAPPVMARNVVVYPVMSMEAEESSETLLGFDEATRMIFLVVNAFEAEQMTQRMPYMWGEQQDRGAELCGRDGGHHMPPTKYGTDHDGTQAVLGVSFPIGNVLFEGKSTDRVPSWQTDGVSMFALWGNAQTQDLVTFNGLRNLRPRVFNATAYEQ